jgi:protein-S-isoprenylcysteine O-methyltransferase Ste14
MTTTSPGVRFPPPFLHAAGFVGGLLADRRWPLRLTTVDRSATLAAGLVLGLAGLGVAISGFATFSRRGTAIRPDRPATTLVTSGPYRWTRNPMYVGLTVAYVGLAVLLRTVWPLLLLPIVLVALVALVIRPEETYLAGAFGTTYDAYRRRVRRWL